MDRISRWEREQISKASELAGDQPEVCPLCGGELADGEGMVGELVLYCPNKDCKQGIAWEDAGGAIARVI